MKITRILLVLAAASTLGLAVFANIRAVSSVATTSTSTLKVADDTTDFDPDFPPDDDGGGSGGGDSGHVV